MPVSGLGLSSLIDQWQRIASATTEGELRRRIASDLQGGVVTKSTVLSHLASLDGDDLQDVLCRSLDTTTHLKLSLSTVAHRGFRIWLHVYKPWTDGAGRFAASIHNHRYSFVGKILYGGYAEPTWEVSRDALGGYSTRIYRAGDINEVDSESVHSLDRVMPNTMTFIVQMPARKSYSVIYSTDGRAPVQLPDLERKLELLIAEQR